MRVSAESPAPSFAGNSHGSIAPRGPAVSFAQLLEDGSSASTIAGQRALSFSETGLMGLHFAPDDGATPMEPPTPGAQPAVPLLTDPILETHDDIASLRIAIAFAIATPVPASVPVAGAAHRSAGMAHRVAEAPQSTFAFDPAGPSRLITRQGGEDDAPPSPFLARFQKKLQSLSSANSRIHLEIFATLDGLAIAAKGFHHDDDLHQQIEILARQVGAEFGMTVRGVFVSNSSAKPRNARSAERL